MEIGQRLLKFTVISKTNTRCKEMENETLQEFTLGTFILVLIKITKYKGKYMLTSNKVFRAYKWVPRYF